MNGPVLAAHLERAARPERELFGRILTNGP
jgi:hypothetical protein